MINNMSHFSSCLKASGLCFATILAFSACLSDETYTTSPTARLDFSTDTLSLDTVLTGQATNTYTFEIYNRNKDAIRLSSVKLEKGVASVFRVNADGMSINDTDATDLEIAGEDSMRIFVFANLPSLDSDEVTTHTDRLIFTTEGGATQSVVLEAYGQDVVVLNALTIDSDLTLEGRRPYVVRDSLVVSAGRTLSLAPGVRLFFHPDASLICRGTLRAEGTAEAPVTLRGDRLGYMFSGQPYDRIPGQWGGVIIKPESTGNTLNFCDIHSGSFGIRVEPRSSSDETLRIENTIVHNVGGDGLSATGTRIFVGNSQITNAAGDCVALAGGAYTFIHCTIGQFYSFTGGRGNALTITNEADGKAYPLEEASFSNCIITGYASDELMGSASTAFPETAFSYNFDHCLIRTPQTDDSHFSNCLWDDDEDTGREKNFSPAFDLAKLIFPFTLSGQSRAVGAADTGITAAHYPLDLQGRARGEAPDLGCYQHTAE